ncbi:hypothetical protein IE077_003549 [Cardiosporidium cionae]|uniref:Uncharacterized protein n=1 Tax=Cardiosporidium cionae TaxID=476202 RepID=A0ABQ7J7Z0_9APIC|nr:hypothetical protein IE077_003549 [Cardiosporidium cionae]|eukprot:KAF8820116.1 hypothetical protein IE077_003549 [Cardiosporidium cionae]
MLAYEPYSKGYIFRKTLLDWIASFHRRVRVCVDGFLFYLGLPQGGVSFLSFYSSPYSCTCWLYPLFLLDDLIPFLATVEFQENGTTSIYTVVLISSMPLPPTTSTDFKFWARPFLLKNLKKGMLMSLPYVQVVAEMIPPKFPLDKSKTAMHFA